MEPTARTTCQELLLVLERLKASVAKLAEAQGLTRVQLFALYSIDKHGDVAMREIAHLLHCDASNVTGIVDRMVAQQLVLRKEAAYDRRAKTLQLTPRGKHAVEQFKAALPAEIGCEKLTAHELQTLQTIASKLVS